MLESDKGMESAQGRSLTGEESVMGWSLTRGRSLTEESSDEGSGSDGVGVGRRKRPFPNESVL